MKTCFFPTETTIASLSLGGGMIMASNYTYLDDADPQEGVLD